MPKVSVAVPVFNGATYLRESLQCLSEQTFRDFEITIYDNASTDATPEIADEFAERDKRFRVVHRKETIFQLDNFHDGVASADCDYFAWRAYDDLSAPNFLECLVKLLDENPLASLAACEVRSYEEAKDRWRNFPVPGMPGNRTLAALVQLFGCHASWFYCLFRRPRLEECSDIVLRDLPGELWAHDHATLFPMLVRAEAVATNETCFIQRYMLRPQPKVKMHSSERWRIYKTFHRFFQDQVDQAGLDPVARAIMKLAVVAYTDRQVQSLAKIARRKLYGQ